VWLQLVIFILLQKELVLFCHVFLCNEKYLKTGRLLIIASVSKLPYIHTAHTVQFLFNCLFPCSYFRLGRVPRQSIYEDVHIFLLSL